MRGIAWFIALALTAASCTGTPMSTTTKAAPGLTSATSNPPATTTSLEPITSSTTATAATTTTTVAVSTTITTTTTNTPCRTDPFTDVFAADIAADHPGIRITAHVHDLDTGCDYALHPDERMPTASVFKVLVLAGTLIEAQEAEREVTDREMALLEPMIRESANDPVRALWRSFGAAPWFAATGEVFGLDETTITADDWTAWGLTQTSAADQVDLLRQLLLGRSGPIGAAYREIAVELMTSVDPGQTWGVTSGVADEWIVAQKNGFAGVTANSVGWVKPPGDGEGYLIAILTTGWSSWQRGIATVERISKAAAAVLTENR